MRIFFQSFGCAKNSVDSENLIGLLNAAGHEVIFELPAQKNFSNQAEAAIINTCGFIEAAVRENVDAVLELEGLKKRGVIQKLIVVGCLFNRYGEELKREIPLVDLWVKSEDWDTVLRFLNGEEFKPNAPDDKLLWVRGLLNEHSASSRYLKITEGCDSFCSYCTIPFIRGRAVSVPMERLITEAVKLCERGAKELCLVGQDTTLYGKDIYYGEPKLDELLDELERSVPDDTWIRLLYLHPNRVTRKFIDRVAGSKKILSYLDIPVQHISEPVLRAMNRSGSEEHIRDIFRYAREADPLFALRTSLMVGFPGETEEDFARLLDFLEGSRIDRVGVFEFSPEEGTKAAGFANQVNKRTKKSRASRLMKLQAEISAARQRDFIGRTLKVLVESIDAPDGIVWGRSYRDAPEVDGLVGTHFPAKSRSIVRPGSFIYSKISDSTDHDLFGALSL